MYEPKNDINYPALLAVIVFGVAAGNLLSNWVTAKVIEAQVQYATAEVNKNINAQITSSREAANEQARRTAEATAASEEQLRQMRRQDATGVRLAQTCNEWQKADAELHSYTTKTETSKRCDHYERYVESGSITTPR